MKNDAQHNNSPRRQRIIEAALSCFTELGFAETTMEHIRKAASASTGSIYHHFRSKEHLAALVYMEGVANFQAGFENVLLSHSMAKEGVFGVIEYHLVWVRQNPEWARYLAEWRHAEFMKLTRADFKAQNQQFFKRVSRWFAEHMDNGTMRALPGDLLISLLMGPVQEYARQYLAGRASTPFDEAKRELGEAAWRSLGSFEPAPQAE